MSGAAKIKRRGEMLKCPVCNHPFSTDKLVVRSPQKQAKWWEISVSSRSEIFCPECDARLEMRGKLRLFLAILISLAMLGVLSLVFDVSHFWLVMIIIAIIIPVLFYIQSMLYVVASKGGNQT